MLLIDAIHTKPTFFENYILWSYSQYRNSYEWKNTRKAIRLGGGLCSQHAIIFNNILRDQGITSRILALGGHVLNEALIDGVWKVYDPDYNVVFGVSLSELESNPQKVYQTYRKAGRPEDEAKHWQEVFGSDADNWHSPTSDSYAPWGSVIEKASFLLIWILPLIFIIFGIASIKLRITKHYR